ncbi:hypothetical protein [Glycomyces paridis]|uniref:Uncharacterized protein n=1 Tax=Glycomyces paridis TaxID=2126555 RepID=A0A4S8PIW0_9ACTN|nr:hypothetical protein [Glycomyces paridis]THV29585.1 hypothetical protein E9998_08800 [Glycomyces paridis]
MNPLRADSSARRALGRRTPFHLDQMGGDMVLALQALDPIDLEGPIATAFSSRSCVAISCHK